MPIGRTDEGSGHYDGECAGAEFELKKCLARYTPFVSLPCVPPTIATFFTWLVEHVLRSRRKAAGERDIFTSTGDTGF